MSKASDMGTLQSGRILLTNCGKKQGIYISKAKIIYDDAMGGETYRLPTGNEKVLYTNIDKEMAGSMLLRDIKPTILDIDNALDALEVRHTILGGGALGIKVRVSEAYEQVRPVTNVIEIVIPKEREAETTEALISKEWAEDRLIDYFFIKYKAEDGKTVRIPSVIDANLFTKTVDGTKLFLEIVLAPAKWYRTHNKGFVIEDINVESYGEMLVRKLARGNEKDVWDMAQIAAADNLAELFGPPSMNLWDSLFPKDNNNGRAETRVKTVISKLEAYKRSPIFSDDDRQRMDANADVLRSLLRTHTDATD